jgi:hypothetical protein
VVSAVGERALAVCRDDSHDVVYCSQWGGSDATLARLFDARTSRFDPLLATDWTRANCVSAGQFADDLDYLGLEAVYVVSPAGVTVSRPVWLGLPCTPSASATDGVLVRVESLAQHRALRAFVRVLKGVLCDAVRGEVLTPGQARDVLALALADTDCCD